MAWPPTCGLGEDYSCSKCCGGVCYEICHPDGYDPHCTGVRFTKELTDPECAPSPWVCPEQPDCTDPFYGGYDMKDLFEDPAVGGITGECIPQWNGAIEEDNGIDDDCDGLVDDEACDGVDNDGDNYIDNERGSCLIRMAIVPFCVDDHTQFATDLWLEQQKLIDDLGIRNCYGGPNDKVLIDTYNEMSLSEDICDSLDCDEEVVNPIYYLPKWVETNPGVNVDEYEVIAFLTDSNPCWDSGVHGARLKNHVWAQVNGFYDPAWGIWEYTPGVLTHEIGHTLGLGEEYCSVEGGSGGQSPSCSQYPNNQEKSPPNYLGSDLGCDPEDGTCCGKDKDKWCMGFISGHFKNGCCGNLSGPGGTGDARCNMGPWYGDGGRDRHFCDRCDAWIDWPDDHLLPHHLRWNPDGIRGRDPDDPNVLDPTNDRGQIPMRCNFEYQGHRRYLSISQTVFTDGRVKIHGYDIRFGRLGLGAVPSSGDLEIELEDEQTQTVLAEYGILYNGQSEAMHPWFVDAARVPVDGATEILPNRRYKIRSYVDGLLRTEATINGAAPVADAGRDLIAECQSNAAAVVTLDGTGSNDPDGDPISFYTWDVAGITLSHADSAEPFGSFPLGTTTVSLKVHDGVRESTPDTVDVTVVDTTAPQTSCTGDTQECIGDLTPVTTTCTAADLCDPAAIAESTAEDAYPLGDYTFTCTATDASGNEGQSTCEVHIVDTTPPVITPSSDSTLEECNPDPHPVELPLPTVTESCGQGDAVLTGELIAVNGKPVTPPKPIPTDGVIVLPIGTATVRWAAVDTSGNQSQVDQMFTIEADLTVDCCLPGQNIYEGTEQQDYVVRYGDHWCVLGWGGGDFLMTDQGDDLLIGGDGADNLNAGPGQDMLIGGDGADTLNCGYTGIYEGHAGPGDDMVQAFFCGSAEQWGGTGNDNVVGSAGADLIVPGPGVDYVSAGSGDDEVVLYHMCEAVPGKFLDGGPGADTLVIPASKTQVMSAGVTIRGFETVIVDSSLQYLSPCF